MESLAAAKSRIYRNQVMTPENLAWRYQGPVVDPYQREHDLLFEAIRQDAPYNEAERAAQACMVSIMSAANWRMASVTGSTRAPGCRSAGWP